MGLKPSTSPTGWSPTPAKPPSSASRPTCSPASAPSSSAPPRVRRRLPRTLRPPSPPTCPPRRRASTPPTPPRSPSMPSAARFRSRRPPTPPPKTSSPLWHSGSRKTSACSRPPRRSRSSPAPSVPRAGICRRNSGRPQPPSHAPVPSSPPPSAPPLTASSNASPSKNPSGVSTGRSTTPTPFSHPTPSRPRRPHPRQCPGKRLPPSRTPDAPCASPPPAPWSSPSARTSTPVLDAIPTPETTRLLLQTLRVAPSRPRRLPQHGQVDHPAKSRPHRPAELLAQTGSFGRKKAQDPPTPSAAPSSRL